MSPNPDDSGWFRMISCLIIRPPRMILQKISGHFCQFWNPRAWMMASNFRRNFVKLWPAVYPPRMAPFGLKLWENAFQTIPDISFFDAENQKNAELWMAVYPSNMAPFGLKLWENAFQTIPNISFFDAEKIFLAKIFDENFRQKKNSSENRQTACFCGAMDFWT